MQLTACHRYRAPIATLLACAVLSLGLATPRTARADEEDDASSMSMSTPTPTPTPRPTVADASSSSSSQATSTPRITLLPSEAIALADPLRRSLALGYLAPTPAEIRLSRGAKTAIIVGAIVGGVLLIVGVIAITKPKPFK